MSSTLSAATVLSAAVCLLAGCGGDPAPDNAALVDALSGGRTAEVTVQGPVVALLVDEPARSDGPHQRFDVRVADVVVEVDYNLDLAPRVPVKVGDNVVIHGEFVPDPGHPIIHDVHHATGSHEGGWLELDGRRYE